jgi:hypothetical protein
MMFARRSLVFIRSLFETSPVLGAMSVMPVLLLAATSFAQQTLTTDSGGHQAAGGTQNAPVLPNTLTIPADTQVALVFTHPLNSKTTHRGDEIYVQTTAPVLANDRVAIPAGTFIQAKVSKLVRHGSRGEMSLDSVAFVFANGYIASVSGPITAESEEGSAFANPTSGRSTAALVAPFAGLGFGALIGSAAHPTHTSTPGDMSIKTNTLTGVAVGSTSRTGCRNRRLFCFAGADSLLLRGCRLSAGNALTTAAHARSRAGHCGHGQGSERSSDDCCQTASIAVGAKYRPRHLLHPGNAGYTRYRDPRNSSNRRFARHAANCDPRHPTHSGYAVSVSLARWTQRRFEYCLQRSVPHRAWLFLFWEIT